MTAREIYAAIDAISPFASQEDWDNSGLALDNQGDCSCVVAALDIDDALVAQLPENACLLLHHPLIFRGLRTLAAGHEARLLLALAAKNCALIAAHTNFDKSHLNRYLAEDVLGLKVQRAEDFVLYCENNFASLQALAEHVKARLSLASVRIVRANCEQNTSIDQFPQKAGFFRNNEELIAICCGSGASMASDIYGKAAVYLTGDVKFHDATAARLNGLNLIDITHYASEKFFGVAAQKALEGLPIEVRLGAFFNPFADV